MHAPQDGPTAATKPAAGRLAGRLFAIDTRALAAFRICLGLVLLVDTLHRCGDLVAFYSDTGVLPRADLHALFLLSDWHWSLHLLAGSARGQAVFFGVAAIAAIAFTVGYRTRLATVVSWVLLASLHARNPLIVYGGDHLLRMLLFWSLFLPLAARWSLDARRRPRPTAPSGRALSAASAAILVQMLLLYLFSGLFKLNQAWSSGVALQRVFESGMFSKSLAHTLLAFPGLLHAVSIAVPWIEIGLPLLLFSPLATQRVRLLAVVALASMHLGFALTLETGIFQWVAWSGLLLFVPGTVWDRLASIIPSRALEPAPEPQSDSAGPAGESAPLQRRHRRLGQAALLAVLAYVVAWNVASLHATAYASEHRTDWLREAGNGRLEYRLVESDYAAERLLGPIGALGRVAKLHQNWAMFTNAGGPTNGWHVVVGRGADGVERSLLEDGRAYLGSEHPRPDPPSAVYPNARWRSYWLYLRGTSVSPIRGRLPGVLARDWNRRHPEAAVDRIRIFFLQEIHGDDGEPTHTRELKWYDGPASGELGDR